MRVNRLWPTVATVLAVSVAVLLALFVVPIRTAAQTASVDSEQGFRISGGQPGGTKFIPPYFCLDGNVGGATFGGLYWSISNGGPVSNFSATVLSPNGSGKVIGVLSYGSNVTEGSFAFSCAAAYPSQDIIQILFNATNVTNVLVTTFYVHSYSVSEPLI